MYQRKIWPQLKEEAQMIEPDMLFRYIPYFFRTFQSAQICHSEKSDARSGVDQTLYSGQ